MSDVMQLRSQILSVTNCLCNHGMPSYWNHSCMRFILFAFALHQRIVGASKQMQRKSSGKTIITSHNNRKKFSWSNEPGTEFASEHSNSSNLKKYEFS